MELLLDTAKLAARAAGEEAQRWYKGGIEPRKKGFREWVTEADIAAQDAAVAVIRERHPEHAILAEEGNTGESTIEGPTWIIDPLDGTTNFVRELPVFCASVGVAIDGRPVAGAIYDVPGDNLFSAAQGQGAFVDTEPLRVGNNTRLANAVIGFDSPDEDDLRAHQWTIMSVLAGDCQTVRSLGSAAIGMAYVAGGQLDAYVHLNLQPWDMAAGAVLVREAGGATRQAGGDEWALGESSIVASNPELMQSLLDLIRGVSVS